MPAGHQDQPILVLNSGSSSLKFGVYARGDNDEVLLASGSAEGIGRPDGTLRLKDAQGAQLLAEDHVLETQNDALTKIAAAINKNLAVPPVAVGHRIVHGGPHLREHQRLTPQVLDQLQASVHLAPLHIPEALKLIKQAESVFPSIPQFGCFDTVFHRTMPPVAATLPLPLRYRDEGVIRYGFHGLSYESIVYRLRDHVPAKAVFAHLGNGASVTAVLDGRSLDTSMGLTPTGGVPMGTRSGDLDPGVVLYLMRNEGLDADALEVLLNQHAGLAGLSGGESDMQALLARAAAHDADADLAVNAFCTGVRKYIGAYAALLGGVDLLVFTGGIGEHSAEVRRRSCEGLAFLGLDVADETKVLALPSEEDVQIARHCRALMG